MFTQMQEEKGQNPVAITVPFLDPNNYHGVGFAWNVRPTSGIIPRLTMIPGFGRDVRSL